MAKWTAADIPDQTGTSVVITGANSGLGLRSAEALSGLEGGEVVLLLSSGPLLGLPDSLPGVFDSLY